MSRELNDDDVSDRETDSTTSSKREGLVLPYARNYFHIPVNCVDVFPSKVWKINSHHHRVALTSDKNPNLLCFDSKQGPSALELDMIGVVKVQGGLIAVVRIDYSQVPAVDANGMDLEDASGRDDHRILVKINSLLAPKLVSKFFAVKSNTVRKAKDGSSDERVFKPEYAKIIEALKTCADSTNPREAGWEVLRGSISTRRIAAPPKQLSKPVVQGASTMVTDVGDVIELPPNCTHVTQIPIANPGATSVQIIQSSNSVVVCQFAKRQRTEPPAEE
jgi:hypothetical protein